MRALLLALLLFAAAPAQAVPVVADLSNYHIDIDARFVGTKLFLFGSREQAGDVIVVVRGPDERYIVRKKESIGGVWVNRRYAAFAPMPSYFAVASSRPLQSLTHTVPLQALDLTPDALMEVVDASSRKLETAPFADALQKYLAHKKLYNKPQELTFMGESLFKASLEFPSTLQDGNYTAEIYLLRDNRVVGVQSLPITVKKIGLEATIESMAHTQPVLYALVAIAMALSAGWLANRIFRKL